MVFLGDRGERKEKRLFLKKGILFSWGVEWSRKEKEEGGCVEMRRKGAKKGRKKHFFLEVRHNNIHTHSIVKQKKKKLECARAHKLNGN